MAFASGALAYMQAQACDNNPQLPSAVDSGMVGVTTNPNNNSYHHSKNSAPFKGEGNYTNRWPNDLVRLHPDINRDAVTGFDQSMNTADMIKATKAYKRVFDDHTDPRRQYFAEIIGTLDGVHAVRMDFGDGSLDDASSDHTWHVHGAWWYEFWNSWFAAGATLSVLRMETKAEYIRSLGGDSAPPVAMEDEEMILTAQLNGHTTVWKGNGVPGNLMAVHSMDAWNAIKGASGDHHKNFDAAQDVVDYLGTLPSQNNEESVAAIEGS